MAESDFSDGLHSFFFGEITDWPRSTVLNVALVCLFLWMGMYSATKALDADRPRTDGTLPQKFTYLRHSGWRAGVLCGAFSAGSMGGVIGSLFHWYSGLELFAVIGVVVGVLATLGVISSSLCQWLFSAATRRAESTYPDQNTSHTE